MQKTLVVVESPKKGKEIQKYLGSDYIVRASAGHVIDLASGAKYKTGIDVDNDFTPVYQVIPEKKDKLAAIVAAAKDVDVILLAADPDREGEAIAWHIAEHLKDIDIPIKRVLFHEITKKGIIKGIQNPKDLDKNLFEAQQSRRVLDRLVGFMVSPFLMNTVGGKVSAGRVQSIAVRMVVDREREIEAFVPDEYWSINAHLSKDDAKFTAKYQLRVTDKATATAIKSDLDSDTYKIIEVIAEEKAKPPLPPLETASLQQAASRKYGIASAGAMKSAQSLYESGLVTYIRTDSCRSSSESIEAAREWLVQNKYKVPETPVSYTAKGNAQDAHECIRPTDINKTVDQLGFIPDDDKKIYTLIRERFLASQMTPALYDTVTATVQSSSGHILKAYGRVLKSKGWMDLLGEPKEKGEEGKLPLLKKGDVPVLVAPKVKAEQNFTKPPSRYRNDTLVGELKKKGIGRPSTYAAIIQKLTDRAYVDQKKDFFFATDLGKKVVDILVKFFDFMKYEYTADMEDKLDQIAEGKISYLEMMNSFYPHFRDQLYEADCSNNKDFGFKCTNCNKPMYLRHGKFGYFMACSGFPTCKTSKSCEIIDGKPVLTAPENKTLGVPGVSCSLCASGMVLKSGKFGNYYSCINYKECNGKAKVPTGIKCQGCESGTTLSVFDGVPKLTCMSYPVCRKVDDATEEALKSWIAPKDINMNIKSENVKVKGMLKPSRDKAREKEEKNAQKV